MYSIFVMKLKILFGALLLLASLLGLYWSGSDFSNQHPKPAFRPSTHQAQLLAAALDTPRHPFPAKSFPILFE